MRFQRHSNLQLYAAVGLLLLLIAGCGEQQSQTTVSTTSDTGPHSPAQPKKAKPLPDKPEGTKTQQARTNQKRSLPTPDLNSEQAQRLTKYTARLREKADSAKLPAVGSAETRARSVGELLVTLRGPSADHTERISAIVELGGQNEPSALELLQEIASSSHATSEERVAALEALAELPQPGHLTAVTAALAASAEEVQTAGVWLLTQIHSEAALPLWQQVMTHPSVEVVAFAFEALPDAANWFQEQAATVALRRAEPWIQERAILTLGGITSKPAVEALISMVDHPTAGDLAHDGLMFLLGESFNTSTEARRWWQKHQRILDATLQPVE